MSDPADHIKARVPTVPIWMAKTPFQKRLTRFAMLTRVPQPGTLAAFELQQAMDMDIGLRLELKALSERVRHLYTARLKGGSGLQMSKILRYYFEEYANRFCEHGPTYFPASFNVMESFLCFDQHFFLFDIRSEVEHLLSINDYFKWYQEDAMRKDPRVLEEVMSEGVVYSYDMVAESNSFRLAGASQLVIAGVSFVRHEHELSCLLLAGENPPAIADSKVSGLLQNGIRTKPNLRADVRATVEHRYLEGHPGYSKVIVLTRLDLRNCKHDVRYVNQDLGPSFIVLSDDPLVTSNLSAKHASKVGRQAKKELARYDDLFSALSALIYLPVFYAALRDRVSTLDLSTDVGAMKDDDSIKAAIKNLGRSMCPETRTIQCLPISATETGEAVQQLIPPEIKFQSEGYWKAIEPHEIGEGKNGERLIGKTWVSRHETWSAQSPQSFLITRRTSPPSGRDPGSIYVQRSPSHEPSLYKIGLTRREPSERAKELSSTTGTPLPFAVLASWEVGDCAMVERTVHESLAPYRVNPRREFFHADLSLIVQTVTQIVKAANNGK